MNYFGQAVSDISTRPPATSQNGSMTIASEARQTSTLTMMPRRAERRLDQYAWEVARQRLGMFATMQHGWNLGIACAPSSHTVQFAAKILGGLAARGMPAPIVNPSADGAIYAHWHRSGIDIELIFEGPYDIVAIIDDSHGEIESFDGDDVSLLRTSEALAEQIKRK